MNEAVLHILHQAFFGGVAAAGFGILFNFGMRHSLLCFAAGTYVLALRTLGQEMGLSLEAASFVSAAALSGCMALLLPRGLGAASEMVVLTGCIPMVPGAFFTQAILGLFALSNPDAGKEIPAVLTSIECLTRVAFTICAIGAGIMLPEHLVKARVSPR